ncbi:MAG: hypothetical protein ACOCXC_05090, partial [Fibrobacterota bacterium]
EGKAKHGSASLEQKYDSGLQAKVLLSAGDRLVFLLIPKENRSRSPLREAPINIRIFFFS